MEYCGACVGNNVSGNGDGIMTQILLELFTDYRSESCPSAPSLPGPSSFIHRRTSLNC